MSTLRNVGSRVQEVAEEPRISHPTNQQVPGQQPNAGADVEALPEKKVGAVWTPPRTKTRSEKRKEEKEEAKLTGCHWRMPVTGATVLKKIKWMERTEHPSGFSCAVWWAQAACSPQNWSSHPATKSTLMNQGIDPASIPGRRETQACSACGGKTLPPRWPARAMEPGAARPQPRPQDQVISAGNTHQQPVICTSYLEPGSKLFYKASEHLGIWY